MAAETIEGVRAELEAMTKARDTALARSDDLNGFRKRWKEKYNETVRWLDEAQAHAWGLEEKTNELVSETETLESMLAHASNTIARLEGRWRAPKAAKAGQIALVVEQGSLTRTVAICIADGGQWMACSETTDIIAWCELPPIPADGSYAELT